MAKRALITLLLFYILPNFANGADDSKFDVAGVRMGMSADDVVANLAKHFEIGRDKLTIQKSVEFGQVTSVGYKGRNQEVLV
ncbi:MAG: hypothetical protein WAV67_02420, partial [Dokdonella sp.]